MFNPRQFIIFAYLIKVGFMNKNNRKEHLYRIAFKLFMTKPFDSVSISDIEKASGMSRGAIVYYGKDKMGLFYNVVKHYLINYQNLDNKLNVPRSEYAHYSLKKFIELYVSGAQSTINKLQSIDPNVKNGSRPYMSLILQICQYFPDLNEEYLEDRNKELLRWIDILQNAIETKEVRKDIDIINTAKNFMCIFYGKSFLDALVNGLNTVEVKMQMMSLYKLLKN